MRAIARTGQSRQHRARTISTSIPAQLTVSSHIRLVLPPEGPDVFLRHAHVSSRQGDDVVEQAGRDVLGVAEGVLRDGRRSEWFADCDRHLDPGCAHRRPSLSGSRGMPLSLIHISEPTRRTPISYAVFCLKKKKK